MEHPYRVHSSIGFGFLQLLMLSSLAYPSPPPPLYHNIALTRMMGTVYFTMFHDKPIYLKLECLTILLEVIRDTLYIWYIIQDFTYIFGVIDIVSNLLFCTVIVLSLSNGDDKWEHINNSLEGIRKTCVTSCCWSDESQETPPHYERTTNGAKNAHHMYSSLPTHENNGTTNDEAPVYTFGSRQAFKPSFYSSSWGRDYLNAKVEREFDRIDHRNNTMSGDVGMVTSADGSTQYIRFDDSSSFSSASASASASSASGAHHYANIFVSPYFMKDGTPITSFSSWTKKDTIGVCLFIYNLIQFIYQLMMYHSIIVSCREYHSFTNETIPNERMMRWLC
jgi:hypothetical protein